MHVRHELQPVLNLKHQRRERAVQPFRLVELLQRLPVLASARVRDVVRVGGGGRVGRRVSAERGLEAVLAHAPDEERHRMPRVSPAVRRPMRMGGGVIVMKSMIPQRAREMRSGRSRKATTVTRPGRGPRDGAVGARRRIRADIARMPYVSNGTHPRVHHTLRITRAPRVLPDPIPPAPPRISLRAQHPIRDSPSLDTLSRTPSTGSVVNRRTRMRPSILTDMFWSVVNLIVAL